MVKYNFFSIFLIFQVLIFLSTDYKFSYIKIEPNMRLHFEFHFICLCAFHSWKSPLCTDSIRTDMGYKIGRYRYPTDMAIFHIGRSD